MKAWLSLWVVSALVAQEPADLPSLDAPPAEPPAPAEQHAEPTPPATEQPPAPPKKKKKRRRKVTAPPKTERARPAPPPAVTTPKKAPRRRVTRTYVPRPGLVDFDVNSRPLDAGQRFLLVGSQGLCAGATVLGTIVATGASALVARAIDRPAGLLLHAPVQLGGIIPLAAAVTTSGLGTLLCVGGLGALGERRMAGPLVAMGAWFVVASVATAAAMSIILVPTVRTTRTLAMKENAVGLTLVAMALMGPLAALVGYHAGALIQERVAARQYASELEAAREAIREDALRPKRPAPAVPPPVKETPAPPVPAPSVEPAPAPPPPPPDIPAEPLAEPGEPPAEEDGVPADPLAVPPDATPR